jgi:hypothetical protein
MAVVLGALAPVFLLIVLGFALKQSLMRLETRNGTASSGWYITCCSRHC